MTSRLPCCRASRPASRRLPHAREGPSHAGIIAPVSSLETPSPIASPWRLCVAPMMDWTDRHCRYFHRLITRRARLYTEMITTGALLHGDVARHLDFDPREHPLALQLG